MGPGELMLPALLVGLGILTAWVAAGKGRNKLLWGVLGTVFPVAALAVVALLDSSRRSDPLQH
jgi:hypothetical protein